jgi:IPT/TIG domain
MGMRRVFVTLLFVSLVLSALTGCGPQFNGSLTGRDGDGTGPKPAPGQPQVTSLSPSTAVAGAASFTLTVNGLNFLPTTTVLWDDNTSLTTTYVSSTVLQAQVPASLIARPETVTIGPSPLSTFNFVTNFTITAPSLMGNNSFSVSTVPVQANDMVWDQASQQFYLSVASRNGTNANTITALNPQTRVLGSSVSTGSEPGRLAVSADGTYIYAGLDSAGSVHRYTLPALQSDIDIPLGSGSYGPYSAIDLAVEPGSSYSVAVARGIKTMFPRVVGGILIYDNAVARPQSVPGFSPGYGSIDSLLWNPNGQSLYGIGTTSGSAFYIMSVSSAGVQLQTQTSAAGSSSGNYLHFDSTTGYLYSDAGKVIDPATGAVIGSFPLNALQGGFNGNPVMVPDGKLNIAYFVGQTINAGGPGNYVIEAFDLTHFTFLGAIPITNVSGTPSRMFRWGSNGLAFLTGTSGAGAAGDGVYLVSGGFVTSPAP